jgi:dihydroorotase
MKVFIKNGRLIDPAENIDEQRDLLLEGGKVAAVGKPGEIAAVKSARVIDAAGLVVAPGFIDMHVHFREPGFEYKETIQTGCESAAAGGVTSVAVMPNTNPVNDTRSVTEWILAQAKRHGVVNVYAIGAITQGLKGERLAELADLKDAGVVGYSDDGRPVMNSDLMRRAFEYSRMCGLPCIQHSEILELTAGGSMNEGPVATELGLKGMPTEAEDIMVYRDIALLQKTGGRLHVAHISSAGSVELVRQAKQRGLPVTAEAAPHHFTLSDEAVRGYDTNTKMSPPLRARRDIDAVLAGLADDTIDIIATDHAPHDVVDKQVEYSTACFGIVGLETLLPLTLRLVEQNVLTLARAVDKLTARPATLFQLDKGTLRHGADADVVVFDPSAEYVIDASTFKSRSKNTPFNGWTVRGKVIHTLVAGKTVYSAPGREDRR